MVRALASHQCGPGSNPGGEFVVGSLLCSERFFSGYSGFPLSSKTNISKFQFDQESGRRRTTLWMCYLQIIIYLFIYLFNEDGAGSNSAVPLTWTDISRQTACFTCGRARLCQLTTHWNYTMYARVCATILKNACWIGSCMQSCTKQGWNFLVPLFNIHNYKRAWVCIRSH